MGHFNWSIWMNTDYIYYLSVEGTILSELIFETEELAEEFAIESGYEEYFVVKWSVD